MKTNHIFRRSLFFVLLTISGSSCVKDPVTPQPPVRREQLIEADVPYGDDDRQRMMISLPEGRDEQTPIVVLIHGGAWVAGNKEDLISVQQFLLANHIGSISISYRYVSDTHHFEGLMEDVGLALASVKTHAPEWGIRSDRYQLLGISAGAHMALLYAYHFQRNDEVSSVVSAAGPTAFTEEFLDVAAVSPLRVPIEAMVGAPIEHPYSSRFAVASPLTYAKDAVPTLLIHGTADATVPYVMSTNLEATLKNNGKTTQLIPLTGADHDLLGDPAATLQALNSVVTWVETNAFHR